MSIDVWLPSEALATSAAHVRAIGCDPVEFLPGKQRFRRGRPRLDRSVLPSGGVARATAIQVRSATLDTLFVVLRRWSRRGRGTPAPRPLGRGAQGRDLGGRDDGGRTGVGVHGPSGTRPGDECEITLDAQVLALGGIAEKVLAAHRGGLGRVLLPLGNRRQVDEDLDDGLRRAVVVDYVTRNRGVGSIWPCIVRRSSSRIPSSRAHAGSIPGTLPASYRLRRRTARCTRRARRVPGREGGIDNTTARSGWSPIPTGFSKMDGS